MIVDLSIGIGVPVLEMLAGKRDLFSKPSFHTNPVPLCGPELVVSGHRFNIIEDFGCSTATFSTPLSFVLVWSWPLIIGIISAGYGGEFPPPLSAALSAKVDLLTSSPHYPHLHEEAKGVHGSHRCQHKIDLQPLLVSCRFGFHRLLSHHPHSPLGFNR